MSRKKRCPERGPDLLRAKLEELGWTQHDLAKAIGATAGPVSRWLSGEFDPSLEMACRIEEKTGVPVASWRRPTATTEGTTRRTGTDG